jgi:formate hydrogenlyase subunit 3/multisubunit Na+/H+ antiporter MnhD subunit
MNQVKINFLRKVKHKAFMCIAILLLSFNSFSATVNATTTGGNKIANSDFGKGTVNMFNDLSLYLLILSPIVGALCAIYFLIRKNAADEQDQKQWNKRLIITGVCVAGAVLVTSTINIITSYYISTPGTPGSTTTTSMAITTTII